MQTQELIILLENAFGKNAKAVNSAIKNVYSYSKQIMHDTDDEKRSKILPLLDCGHVYVKYWGAVIALSYHMLEERAIREMIYILDINPKDFNMPLDLNLLKMDVGGTLYDYKKHGAIGSFPGHNNHEKISVVPRYESVVSYYKRKYRIP